MLVIQIIFDKVITNRENNCSLKSFTFFKRIKFLHYLSYRYSYSNRVHTLFYHRGETISLKQIYTNKTTLHKLVERLPNNDTSWNIITT